MKFDFLVVGAGFAGAVLAERLASQLGKRCLVIDRRSHIAGNSYDRYDEAGVLIHQYGPHYFRTNSQRIVDYLSQFTEWHPVDYKILSWVDGKYWQFPINLNTFEQLVGHPASTEEMEATLEKWRVKIDAPQNSEEVIISQVGWKLYEMFFKNYTRKQWQREPKDLDASVCGRIPIRTNRDNRYLSENFQALPKNGYTALIRNILNHPNIEIALETSFDDVKNRVSWDHLIWSGPIDEYFEHCFDPLPYRSLRFEFETHQKKFYQPTVQINYPNDFDYTRIVETKHVTGQRIPVTTISREFPDDWSLGKEAYYPIPTSDSLKQYERYANVAATKPGITFLGRLATYRYYNMDQIVGMALVAAQKLGA